MDRMLRLFKRPATKEPEPYFCAFIPQEIIEHLEEAEGISDETRASLRETIEAGNKEAIKEREEEGDTDKNPHEPDLPDIDDVLNEKQIMMGPRNFNYGKKQSESATVYIYNASLGGGDVEQLPGILRRKTGEAPGGDRIVNECFETMNKAQEFFRNIYGWDSFDDLNSDLIASVNFGDRVANAFFFPTKKQMVFGNGNPLVTNFTKSYEVVGHELTHGITANSSGLIYQDKSGALAEHCADVMGSLLEQWVLNLTADQADWLLAQDVLLPRDPTIAMRSMKAPGTAYDDPRLGKDRQPGHMKDYVVTSGDNGGVHINSGIPNHAFYLAATRYGGKAWEVPGRTWFKAMTTCKPNETFVGFAKKTIAEAKADGLDPVWPGILTQAWKDVGVLKTTTTWSDWWWQWTGCGGKIQL